MARRTVLSTLQRHRRLALLGATTGNGSRYYDAYASACLVCGKDAAGQVATLICVVLAVLLLVGLFLRFRPDRKIKCLVRLSLRLTSLYTQISLRAKCSKAARTGTVSDGAAAQVAA